MQPEKKQLNVLITTTEILYRPLLENNPRQQAIVIPNVNIELQ